MNFPLPTAQPSISFEGTGKLRRGNKGLGSAPVVIRCDAAGNVSVWLTSPTPQQYWEWNAESECEFTLTGSLNDGRLFECSKLRAVSLPDGLLPRDAVSFRARKMVVGREYVGGAAAFLVTNLLLPNFSANNQSVIAAVDDVEVELIPDLDYAERMKHLRAYKGIDVTATLRLTPRDARHDVRDLANELCLILSVLTGQRTNWIGVVYDDSIALENRVTKPCSAWPVVGRLNKTFGLDWSWDELLRQTVRSLPHFRQFAQRCRLGSGLVDAWIDARLATDFLESRCLKVVAVLEAIKHDFRPGRNEFRKRLEGACADIGVSITPTDMSEIVDIRNNIVHEGEFIEPHTLSKIERYELVTRHTDRIMLGLVGVTVVP